MDIPFIEINDAELRVARGSEIVVRSPAYIVVSDHTVQIGEQARQQAHLHPQKMYNRFWNSLNQNDLQTVTRQFRHNADLAFAQLVDIHKQAGMPDEMVFSVPGSLSADQLSLLLGIVEACPFRAVGLVDSAVAAASAVAGQGNYQHLDIELHRAVMTGIDVDEEVVRDGVEIIDQTGLADIYDTAAELIADTMIRQCRFDPQRQAESEQALYDQLPHCLDELATARETIFEIRFQGTQHQVRIERETMLERLSRHYDAILKGLDPARSCMVTDRLARLPGFAGRLPAPILLDESCVFQGILQHLEEVHTDGPALNYVTRLTPAPAQQQSMSGVSGAATGQSAMARPAASQPPSAELHPPAAEEREVPPTASHLLHNHSAYALSDGPVYLSPDGPVSPAHRDSASCSVAMVDGLPVLRREGDGQVIVNGERLDTMRKLATGDRIETGSDSFFTLITVVPNHGPAQ